MKIVADEVTGQQVQFGVAPQDMITTLALDRGDKVDVVTSTRTRVLVVVAGVGLMVSVAGTIAIDALVRRRQRRRDFDASEEMLGAKVPRQTTVDAVSWNPPRHPSDPQRPPTARTIREPERSAEIVPVGWPVPASVAPVSTSAPENGRRGSERDARAARRLGPVIAGSGRRR